MKMAKEAAYWADKPVALVSETGALTNLEIPAAHPAAHFPK
jgi:hypothetical protein